MDNIRNNTEKSKEHYKNQRREAKRLCRQKKREFLEKQLEIIEENYAQKEVRDFYQGVKKTRATQNKYTMFCRNKDGTLLGGKTEKLNRWAEYFEELLNDKGQTETEMQQQRQEIEQQQIQETEQLQI
uniref:Uncharacterized protein LOC114340348 n=1 Tax=Diabrotica virgifera virgifera TaxID=50390 RepID=A0A6P7GC59_DIAVI